MNVPATCKTFFGPLDDKLIAGMEVFCTKHTANSGTSNSNGCECADPGWTAPSGAVGTSSYTIGWEPGATIGTFIDCTAAFGTVFPEDIADKIIPILEYFEVTLECSGICDPLPMWLLSKLSSHGGPPPSGCLAKLPEFFDDNFGSYGNVFLAVGSVSFIAWFIQFGLCCRKELSDKKHHKKGKKKDGVKKFSDDS
jgi:hypothetical protein